MADQNRSARVDWEDLRVLLELARLGSLSATARALGVTHVTISRRIANLERDLDQALFVREAGRYVLTEAGRRITELAGPMAASSEAVLRAASELQSRLTGPVRVTATEAVGIHIVMPGLRELRRRHPDLEIDLQITQQNLSLSRNAVDVAVRLARPDGDTGLVGVKAAELIYHLYAARSYVEGRKPEQLEYIGYSQEFSGWIEAQTLERIAGGGRLSMRINHLGNRIEAARLGLGAALIPEVMAELVPELVRIGRGEPIMRRDVFVLMHEDLKEVPRVKACFEALVETIRRRHEGDG